MLTFALRKQKMVIQRAQALATLREQLLRLEGFKPSSHASVSRPLGPLQHAFPHGVFPLGVIHEFRVDTREQVSATTGFIAGLLSFLVKSTGTCLWIGRSRTLFPPALKSFGLAPERFICVTVKNDPQVLWATEEALKCPALSAVVSEAGVMSFTASRRLQLCVEKSQVTGFILHSPSQQRGATASVARWQISSLPSVNEEGLPGIGYPQWKVDLMRIRNGRPGSWHLQWTPAAFRTVEPGSLEEEVPHQQAG